jgi:hypothetical protein
MALDWNVRRTSQAQLFYRSIVLLDLAAEHAVLIAEGMKVSGEYPVSVLVSVSSSCPVPQGMNGGPANTDVVDTAPSRSAHKLAILARGDTGIGRNRILTAASRARRRLRALGPLWKHKNQHKHARKSASP